jgi:hypothetical protein
VKAEGSQSFEILRQWEPGLRPHHLELGDLQPISNWRVQYRRRLWDYRVHPKAFRNQICRIWSKES